jgi:hypothetical protein
VGRQTMGGGSPNDYKEEPIQEEPSLRKPTTNKTSKGKETVGSVGGFSDKEKKEVIFSCLEKVNIPEQEKIRLCKMHSEKIIKKSVAHCTQATFKPNKSLESSIFYFAMNPDYIKPNKEQVIESKKIEQLQKENKAEKRRFLILDLISWLKSYCKEKAMDLCLVPDDSVSFLRIRDAKGGQDQRFKYDEISFREPVENAIRKLGLPIPGFFNQIP